MREILFRGKTAKGEWVEGYLIKGKYYLEEKEITAITSIDLVFYPRCEISCYEEVIPKSIGQFTGLTDKNGKKIFEGDIIRYADESEYRCYLESLECPEDYEGVSFNDLWTIDEVVYGINIGYPAFDMNNHEWETNGLSCLNDSGQYFYEVIGNIHDNPELLGE